MVRNWDEWERQKRIGYYRTHRPEQLNDEVIRRLVADCDAYIQAERVRLEEESDGQQMAYREDME